VNQNSEVGELDQKLTFRIDGPNHGGGTFWTFFSVGNEEQTSFVALAYR
jgi:hypothetical protein